MKKDVPVLLLTGYLGAGKTTLLNRILTNERGIRFAVIVNDLGEVNIDASLIQKGGVVCADKIAEGEPSDLVALQNGCICCTLRTDLLDQLAELVKSGMFDYIVIEASGICEPAPIAQSIMMMPRMEPKYTAFGTPRLDCICTVVDALRLRDEWHCGEALAPAAKAHTGKDGEPEESIERLVIEQIEFCNIILLNKISCISPEEAARVRAIVRAIQPKAEIIECDYCDVPLDRLLNTHLFNFERVATSATWVREIEGHEEEEEEHEHDEHEHHHDEHEHHNHEGHDHEEHDHEHEHDHDEHEHHDHEDHDHDEHEHGHHHHHHDHGGGHDHAEEYGIKTFVYQRRPGFDMNKFDWLVTRNWPTGIVRCKGVVYFNHDRDMSYLFESAGSQKSLTKSGYWYATAPKEELEAFMTTDPQLRRDWDPDYGDRMIKLVFITRNVDEAALRAALDAC